MDNSKTILAKNIRYLMEQKQKTRTELCEALDIKYTTLSDWVNGKTYPRIDKLERLAAYFGIEKSALLEDREHLPPDAIPYTPRQTRPIPIVGVVNCGVPLLAEENIEGYIETPLEDLNSGEEYFWLLIRKQNDVDSGDIAVVSVNGDDATLKRVIKKENALVLQPENPAYEMKILVGKEMEDVHIRGRLMQLEKRF